MKIIRITEKISDCYANFIVSILNKEFSGYYSRYFSMTVEND